MKLILIALTALTLSAAPIQEHHQPTLAAPELTQPDFDFQWHQEPDRVEHPVLWLAWWHHHHQEPDCPPNTVPEPGTWVMVAMGAGLVGWRKWGRR